MIIETDKDLPDAPVNITMTLRAPAPAPTKFDYSRASGSGPGATQRHSLPPKVDYSQASGSRATQSHATTLRPPAMERTIPSPRPEPPPYSAHSFPVFQPPPPRPSLTARASVPVFQSPPHLHSPSARTTVNAVNQLHINNNKEDVFGTFAIDPLLPIPPKHKPKKGSKGKKAPDATFKTKNGAVSLNLSTQGSTAQRTKSFVEVATRKGDINIDLFQIQPQKNISLDVYSRKGNILVLIPRNFRGCIQIRSRKKGYEVLPALSGSSRALNSTAKEILVLVGEPSSDQDDTDYLQLESNHGKVIVGISNEDEYQPNTATFWQKFFGIEKS